MKIFYACIGYIYESTFQTVKQTRPVSSSFISLKYQGCVCFSVCMSVPSTGRVRNIINCVFLGLQTVSVVPYHIIYSEAEVNLITNI